MCEWGCGGVGGGLRNEVVPVRADASVALINQIL